MSIEPTRTRQLATFIVDSRLDGMDDVLRQSAIAPIVDSIGVMLAGLQSDAGKGILRYAQAVAPNGGSCWVPGVSTGAPADVAPLINSTLAHALDYDDAMPGAGHPSALVLAAVLATAESAGVTLDGRTLMEAFIVGFEATVRSARAIGVQHYFKGWHTTSTAGSFGTTAAAAKILGLNVDTTAIALGIAGSLASGIQRNFGTATKPLHSGLAARNGVMAARLAQGGFTAADNIFDGPRGFLDIYGVGGDYEDAFDALGAPWALIDPGTALKKFPCCYATARAIDATLQLRERYGLQADQIDEIACTMAKGGPQALIYSRPQTGLHGKFSMEYVLSAAILDGEVVLNSFTDEAVQRPAIRALLERVSVAEDPRCRPEDPDALVSSPATGGFIEVAITTKDGKTVETAVSHPPGSTKNPFSQADLEKKFLDCARFGGFAVDSSKRVFAGLSALPEQSDVIGLLRTLALA